MSAILPRTPPDAPYRSGTTNLTEYGYKASRQTSHDSEMSWEELHADVYPYGLLTDGVRLSRIGYRTQSSWSADIARLGDVQVLTIGSTPGVVLVPQEEWTSTLSAFIGDVRAADSWREWRFGPIATHWRDRCGWVEPGKAVSSERLRKMAAAVHELAEVVARGEARPSPAALSTVWRLLQRFTTDGAPAPQIGATSSASIELVWLRRGLMVSFLVDRDGSLIVWSQDANDVDRFEFEADSVESLSALSVKAVEAVLLEMAQSAVGRP